ncbi:CBO0543 family protein [Pseudoneobacillus sp. C159]
MSFDYLVILALWVICPFILLITVPRYRIREFIAVFFIFQTLTWLFSITLTAFDLLSFPIRLFPNATKIGFTMEYLVYPTAAVLFYKWFPERATSLRRAWHYFFSVSGFILIMFLLGKYTNLLSKVSVNALIRSYFNFTVELWLCKLYVQWLLKKTTLQKVG